MDNDESLQQLWQRQQPSPSLAQDLFHRVKRHRHAVIAQRTVEVVMTLAAVGVLGWPVWTGDLAPVHWLLIPFFSVFLIVTWTVVLRQGLGANLAVSEDAASFAKERQRQLLASLKNLKLAERSAIALLIYAAVAFLGGQLVGDGAWKLSVNFLLVYSAGCYLATRWLVRRRRRASWREYRAVGRIA